MIEALGPNPFKLMVGLGNVSMFLLNLFILFQVNLLKQFFLVVSQQF